MLSAVKDSAKRLKVLEAGASDYLTKPFHPKELELRVNSLLEVGSQRPSANVSAAAATQTPQPNATQPKAEQPNVAQPSEAPVMQPKKMPKSSLKRHVSYLQRFYMSFML